MSAKIPTTLLDAADAEAERRRLHGLSGADRTALIVEALAAKFGLSVPVEQEELPLFDAA